MEALLECNKKISVRHEKAIDYALNQIKSSALCPYVKNVILFGSCARNEQKWKSDLDLCMILSPSVREKQNFKKALYMLKGSISDTDVSSVEVDLKVLVGDEWEKNDALFYKNIRKDGISIWR